MRDDTAIKVSSISKSFKLPHEKHNSLKDKAVHVFGPRNFTKFKALEDISFEVKKGEFFGIVGKNGSGKSTLLKILANIYQPTKGKVEIDGTLAPFIELGVGFNPELTGRENVFLSGTILGMKRKKIEEIYDEIVDFAEMGEFMDQKLKNYSSGMQVRLAFSIAVRAESDILLIDEVLAVGDAAFQAKCFEYFYKLKESSRTIIFISHDMNSVKKFCDRALLINDSNVIKIGDVESVVDAYSDIHLNKMILEQKKQTSKTNKKSTKGPAEITNVSIGDKGTPILQPDEEFTVNFSVKANVDIPNPVVGVTIKQKESEQTVFADNTDVSKISTQSISKDKKLYFSVKLKNVFSNGTYLVTPAIADKNSLTVIDRKENATFFISKGWDNTHMPIQVPHKIEIKYD